MSVYQTTVEDWLFEIRRFDSDVQMKMISRWRDRLVLFLDIWDYSDSAERSEDLLNLAQLNAAIARRIPQQGV